MVKGVEIGRSDQSGALETGSGELVRGPELGHVVVPDQHTDNHLELQTELSGWKNFDFWDCRRKRETRTHNENK